MLEHDICNAMHEDRAEATLRLTLAIAIEQDAALQDAIRNLAGAADQDCLFFSLPHSSGWLKLGDGSAEVFRTPQAGFPRIDVEDLMARHPGLSALMMQAAERTSALEAATHLLADVFEPGHFPSRGSFLALWRWTPMLEHTAYRYAARSVAWLDSIRRSTLETTDKAESERRRLLYWNGAVRLGHATLLASSKGARDWLADMAESFAWSAWTPSFPLLRERTMWLAAVAGRSAAAFGSPVIDGYLAALERARAPMQAFDALFGLAAIALGDAGRNEIAREIRRRQSRAKWTELPDAPHIEAAFRSALRLIADPGDCARRVLESGILSSGDPDQPPRLFSRAMMCSDPGAYLASGDVLGIAALPIFLEADPGAFYPERPRNVADVMPAADEVAAMLRRAWAGGRVAVELH